MMILQFIIQSQQYTMDVDMQIKQSYLRTEILQKQYDAQSFIQFLNQKLNIGDDLALCTFQDLKLVVQEFIKRQNTKFKEQEESMIKSQSFARRQSLPTELSRSTIITKPRTIIFDKYNFAEPEFSKTFRCIKTNQKYHKEFHCQVCNPERKTTGGFFGIGATSYLEFQVHTIETGWKVGRRYSDFQWLRNFLKKLYPTQIIPPIPQKKAAKRTQRHVEKRMRILQYFLNDVMSIPQFKNNKYVEGFLRITEASQLVQLKEDSQKIKISGNINEVQTQTGQINIKLNAQNRTYLQEMKKFIPQIQKMYKQITRKGKALQIIQLDQVNTLYEMGNLFAQIHQRSKDVLNKVPKAEGLRNLNEVYVTLNNMTIQWGNLIKGQYQIIQKNFNTFFKYIRNDLHGYLQMFQLQEQYEDEFARARIALDKKKQKIYSLFDMSKWQISKEVAVALPKQILHDKAQAFKVMLPRQNNDLDKQRLKACLYISQLFKNGSDNFKRSAMKFKQNFKQWSIKIKVNTQQINELWSEMAASFAGQGKIKQLKEKPIIQNTGNQIMED